MQIYIPNELSKFQLTKIISDLVDNYNFQYPLDYEKGSELKLPVDEFIDCITLNLDESNLDYVKEIIWKAKGTTEVLELTKKYLDIDLDYNYTVNNLEVTINSISTTDPGNILSKFESYLYYLLHYFQLTSTIEKLNIKIEEELDTLTFKTKLITYLDFQ